MDRRELKEQILKLYPEYKEVYFYIHSKNYREYVTFSPKIGVYTALVARVKLEIKLGRRLVGDETVDHEDNDPFNDNFDNLQVLSMADNQRKLRNKKPLKKRLCTHCSKLFELSQNTINKANRKGRDYFFCSKSCANYYATDYNKLHNEKVTVIKL